MPVPLLLGNRLVTTGLFSGQTLSPAGLWSWILAHLPLAFGLLLATLLLLWLGWDAIRLFAGTERIDQLARQRAETLLRESVSPDQYRQLQRCGYLEITSKLHANRTYRIPRQRRRIEVFHSGHLLGELCVVAVDPVPDADLVLTHKWMLESDEEGYLAMANWIRSAW